MNREGCIVLAIYIAIFAVVIAGSVVITRLVVESSLPDWLKFMILR